MPKLGLFRASLARFSLIGHTHKERTAASSPNIRPFANLRSPRRPPRRHAWPHRRSVDARPTLGRLPHDDRSPPPKNAQSAPHPRLVGPAALGPPSSTPAPAPSWAPETFQIPYRNRHESRRALRLLTGTPRRSSATPRPTIQHPSSSSNTAAIGQRRQPPAPARHKARFKGPVQGPVQGPHR